MVRKELLLSTDLNHAVVAYLIKKYAEISKIKLGRTILQKLCYFAKSHGVPLPFRFEIYHYGPFSQEIFETTEDLIVDEVLSNQSSDPGVSHYVPGPKCEVLLHQFEDALAKYRGILDTVADTFSELSPSQMELVSTIHYIHSSSRKKAPSKSEVVDTVYEIKKPKFDREFVDKVYDVLLGATLLD